MSYYQRYRPQQFSDLLGQDHVKTVLTEALKSDRLAHAYLFCGTRGTGKTSTARLLAKTINCQARLKKAELTEPCNVCEFCVTITAGNCMDVIEIDAASNRGIDEIRQLQEQVRFRPQQTVRKIFIIDEVHMLTKEAFNALLKTLEEPPQYLVFILATTEAHKLPATVISRCQRFDFQTPDAAVLSTYLSRVAEQETIKVESDALQQIVQLAGGSFRDASTILEQLASAGEPVSLEVVRQRLGLPEEEILVRYLNALASHSDPELSSDLVNYFDRGGSASAFIDLCFSLLERQVKDGAGPTQASLVLGALVRVKYQMRYSPLGSLPILAGLGTRSGMVAAASTSTLQPAVRTVSNSPKTDNISDKSEAKMSLSPSAEVSTSTVKADPETTVAEPPVIITEIPADTETVSIQVAEQVPPAELPEGELSDKWQVVLDKLLAENHSSLLSILRTAKPLKWESPELHIGVQFKFHGDQLVRQKNRDILETLFGQVLGGPVKICTEVMPVNDLAAVAEELSI